MKKIFLFVSPLIFLVACSSGGDKEAVVPVVEPEISGCMDDCALNYDPNATVNDVVCVYSFLGTYTISEYTLDGISLFSDFWENPMVAGAISFGVDNSGVGIYTMVALYEDGLEYIDNGSFINSETQLMFYSSDGSDPALWTTTKINCLEFDGNSMVDGMLAEIELTYYDGKLDNLERIPTNSKFEFKRK